MPHGIFGCASFQLMMPKPGRNISATAVMVVVLVSNLCSTPSVAQNPISVIDSSNSLISDGFIGPSSDSDLRIPSRPPGTWATSAGIIRVITK